MPRSHDIPRGMAFSYERGTRVTPPPHTRYRAPELLMGIKNYGPRVDEWCETPHPKLDAKLLHPKPSKTLHQKPKRNSTPKTQRTSTPDTHAKFYTRNPSETDSEPRDWGAGPTRWSTRVSPPPEFQGVIRPNLSIKLIV